MLTLKAKLIAQNNSDYQLFVFDSIDSDADDPNKFFTLTCCPNWQGVKPSIGDIGFVNFEIAHAGDTYFDNATKEVKTYKYTNMYFISFVPLNVPTKNIYELN